MGDREVGPVEVLLDYRRREVCHLQGEGGVDDRPEDAEPEVAGGDIDQRTGVSPVPVVPQIDVDGFREPQDEHDDVDQEAHDEDHGADLCPKGNGRRHGPPDIDGV